MGGGGGGGRRKTGRLRFLRISSIVETLWDVFWAGIVSVWEEYININAVRVLIMKTR